LKVNGAPVSVSVDGPALFVLQNNNKIAKIDIDSFSLVKEFEVRDFESTSLAYSNDEVWVGDKKGLIHILDPNEFS
jgi:hypothetical protein